MPLSRLQAAVELVQADQAHVVAVGRLCHQAVLEAALGEEHDLRAAGGEAGAGLTQRRQLEPL